MAVPSNPTYGFRRPQTSKTRGLGLNNGAQRGPSNGIQQSNGIIWLGWKGKYSKIIRALNRTAVYQTVFARFIKNQDNVFISPKDLGGSFGVAPETRGANGYTINIGFNGFLLNGELTADPTFIAKVVMHEGLHTRYHMARSEGKLFAYPTLYRHYKLQEKSIEKYKKNPKVEIYEGDHQAMAEGNVGTLVQGMIQFDRAYGASHSKEWYIAMAWWGSLTRATSNWQKMPVSKKSIYEKIQQNEYAYMKFLTARATYKGAPSDATKNDLSNKKLSVNWVLFKQTRTKTK